MYWEKISISKRNLECQIVPGAVVTYAFKQVMSYQASIGFVKFFVRLS